jgi:hypothetical protein
MDDGSASVFIELKDGVLKVYHGTDKALLFQRRTRKGTWNSIWRSIKAKKAGE